MIDALRKTFGQLASRSFAWVLVRALGLTLILFVALFWLTQWGLGALPATPWSWLDAALKFLAGAGLIVSFFFLLFPVAALFVGMFLEEVAAAVEARHYPGDAPAKGPDLLAGLSAGIGFFLTVVALNLVLLPVYLFLPVLNVFVFLVVNGYLIGREYFEMVALRHAPPPRVRRLRRRFGWRIFGTGLVIAIPLTIPLVNLIGPLFGAALMVHVYKDIERRALDAGI